MAKRSLLLDFQHDGIDWILMRSGLREVTLEKSGRLACPAHAVSDPATLSALQDLRNSLDIPGLACLATIGGRGMFIRHIAAPFRDKRKVRQILPMELEATLPVAADGLAVDFQMAGREDGHAAVAVAMDQARIAAHLQILREAGLDPVLVTFSGLPAAVLLAAGPQGEETALLLDGDDRHGLLFIVGGRRIQYMRSWRPPAGRVASESIKTAIQQTLEAAGTVLPDDITPSAIYVTPRSTRCYPPEALSSDDCPARVFDLKTSFSTLLEGSLPADHGQGALALGLYESLAEKGLNFYRSTFPLKRLVQQYRRELIRTAAMAAVLTVLFMVNVYVDIRRAEQRTALLEAEAAAILKKAFPETRNVVDPLQQMIVNVRELRSHDPTSSGGLKVAQIDILDTISQALPKTLDIHVSQLVSGMDRIQLGGTTGTFEAVNETKELLEKTAFFEGITIVSANMDQNAGRVRFKLAIEMKNGL